MRKVPKLRFKEFNDEWEENKLGDISKITSGLTPLRSEEKFYLNGVIPWVKTSDLNNSYIKKTEEKISEFALKETSIKLLPKNTLLVAMYGGFNQIGRTGLTTIEATTNQALSAIKFRDINKFPLFFQNVLNYKVDYWKKVSASSRKDPNITKKDIEDFKVIYPKLEEQEKIANFLSSVEKKISLTEEKLELFREYKKGVMQKIFSQELRFKDNNGNDYPEWEEKKLEDIVNINKGKQLNKELLEKQGEYPVINGGILPSGYTDKYNTLSNTITISEGGNSCGYVNFIKNNFWAGGHCYILNKKIEINYKYLYQLLKFNEVNIMDLRVGSGLPNIQKSAINNYKINISTTLEEQQKIADFLSSIDSKIESIEKELERLKEFKRGLLQQMFV